MNLLLTTVGRRNYLIDFFRNEMSKGDRIIVTNSVEEASGMYVADKSYVCPPIRSEKYLPFILDLIVKEKIDAIIPLFDLDLSALSQRKTEIEALGTKLIASDYAFIDTCFDKMAYESFLKPLDIQSPKTYIDLNEATPDLKSGKLHFPLVLKPRWGMGSVATEIVKNENDLSLTYTYLSNKLEQSFLTDPVPEGYKNSIMVQSFSKGVEYGLDVINDLNGNYFACVVRKKLAMRAGETDAATVLKNPILETLAEKIGKASKHIGVLDIDLILTETNDAVIIDMNPRFGGGYPFSHIAGANVPKLILSWLKNDTPEPASFKYDDNQTIVKGISLHKSN